MLMKDIPLLLLIIIPLLLISGCSESGKNTGDPVDNEKVDYPGKVVMGGSEDVLDLYLIMKGIYWNNITMSYRQGGEDSGIIMVLNDLVDIGLSNRNMTNDDLKYALVEYTEIPYYDSPTYGTIYMIFESTNGRAIEFMEFIMIPNVWNDITTNLTSVYYYKSLKE